MIFEVLPSLTQSFRLMHHTSRFCSQLVIAFTFALFSFSNAFAFTVDFSYHIDCQNQVSFTNLSTGYVSVLWDFGDGSTSSLIDPTHTYATAGTYTVELVINNGSYSLSKDLILILYNRPIASLSGPTDVCIGSPSVFSSSFTMGNSYLWNIGGSHTTNQLSLNSVEVVWALEGAVDIMLIETNPAGCSDSVVWPVAIHPLPQPRIRLSIDSQSVSGSFCAGSLEPYQVMPFPGDTLLPGSIFQWTITGGTLISGQGTDSVGVQWGNSSSGLLHLVETTQFGCIDSTEMPISLFQGPTANFSAHDACLGDLVQFTDQSTGNITSHVWDFGDGTTSSSANPQHTYATVGTYTVTLTVIGTPNWNLQCSHSYASTVAIDALPGPEIVCPGALCAGSTETYSTTPVSGATYNWSVTGGTIVSGGGTSDSDVTIQWGNGPSGTISLQLTGSAVRFQLTA